MKNNKGFTLVEVIISIAVLSIISVIFLQLFVKAKDIDDSAYQLDRSVMISNSAIEQIKALEDLSTIEGSNYFDTFEIRRESEGLYMTSYFDKDMVLTLQDKDKYMLNIEVYLSEELQDESAGLYVIEGHVINNVTSSIIYSVKTKAILGR